MLSHDAEALTCDDVRTSTPVGRRWHATREGHNRRKPERKFDMSSKANNDFVAVLGEIREASKKFDEAASAATKAIESLEEQLLEIEPGISVWTDAIAETSEEQVGESGEAQTVKRVVKLGFAKIKKWGIAVSEDVFEESGKRLSSEQALLRKSDRDLRLLGAAHLGALLDALKDSLSARLETLPSAETEAESDAPSAELAVESDVVPVNDDETQAA